MPCELKSPYSAKTLPQCRHIVAGLLSRRHPYHTQIQFQMYVMKAKIGFFVTYVDAKIFVEKIHASDSYKADFEAVLKKL